MKKCALIITSLCKIPKYMITFFKTTIMITANIIVAIEQ